MIQNLERKMRSPDSQRASLEKEIERLEGLLVEQKEDQDTMQKYYEGQLETLNDRMDRLKKESWANRNGGGGKAGPPGKSV